MEALMDISELADAVGVSARTIRYYGELRLVLPERRGPGGRRMFGPEARERLEFVQRLKSLGLTLQEIRDLNEAFETGLAPAMLERLETTLQGHLNRVQARLAELGQLDRDLRSYLERIRAKR